MRNSLVATERATVAEETAWGRRAVKAVLGVCLVAVLALVAIGAPWWAVLAAAFLGALSVLYAALWRKAAKA
jgi:hypothetical protein